MSSIRLEIVTAERVVYSEDVDLVAIPGVEGELGILPRHTPLLTMLKPGELRIKKGGEEIAMAVSGGFVEVRPEKIIVLADAAERADEIDEARAEAARQRVTAALSEKKREDVDFARMEAALQRSLVRLKVAQRRKKSRQ
jgi:F-type H+-transporting ATPase subunit epsilon